MKQMGIALLFFILLSLKVRSEEISWQTQQEEVAVTLHLASSLLTIPDSLLVRAEMTYPSSYSVSLDTFKQSFDLLLSDWSLVKQQMTTSQLDHQKTLHLEAELAPLKEGDLFFSLFDIRFSDASTSSAVIWTPIFTIHVNPAADPSTSIAPVLALEPQYQVSLSLANRELLYGPSALDQEALRIQQRIAMQSFPWLFVLFVILGSIGWFLWKSLRGIRDAHLAKPKESPSQVALKALKDLSQRHLPQQGLYKEYFTALSAILRDYLENAFSLPASFKTTDELKSYIEWHPKLAVNVKAFLNHFFTQADEIKFAKDIPSEQECEEAYGSIQQFIQANQK